MAGQTRAAQYIRMSTEHQRYSIEGQRFVNEAYALERGYEVTKIYCDAGISGLTLKHRPGLQALLADVVAGRADFSVILVYDVSRWGRFQDPDQGAHYEFICREAGVRVEYCAEEFENAVGITAAIVKNIKRVMAAEFSRELSVRTTRAHTGLALKGYLQAGEAGYGYRRMAVRPDRKGGRIMERGDHNGNGEYTVVVKGPPEEVAAIRKMFRDYAAGVPVAKITAALIAAGTPAPRGGKWTGAGVRLLLHAERYTGVLIFGRTRQTLGVKRKGDPEQIVRLEGAFEPLVSKRLFNAVQARLKSYVAPRCTQEEMIARLKEVLARRGALSGAILDSEPGVHSGGYYRVVFGSLERVYALAGYEMSPRQRIATRMIRRRGDERLVASTAQTLHHRSQTATLDRAGAGHGVVGRPLDPALNLSALSDARQDRIALAAAFIVELGRVSLPSATRPRPGRSCRARLLRGYRRRRCRRHALRSQSFASARRTPAPCRGWLGKGPPKPVSPAARRPAG